MSSPLPTLDNAAFAPDRLALLLDFDGTLCEISETPDAVVVETRTRDTLARLVEILGGAVAIVTGRDIEDIDAFTAPLRLPVAGVHGTVRRDHAGRHHAHHADPRTVEALGKALRTFAAGHDGLLVEAKTTAVALHYRKRPDLEAACSAEADRLAACHDTVHLVRGKMVIEFKVGRHTKADAVKAFMEEAPFAGRMPLFAGDDVTDEDAFEEVARRGGVTLKVGDGITSAAYRARDTGAFLDWLDALAGRLSGMRAADDERTAQ